MKKNLKSIMMAVAALLSITMTSCQEDELIAMTLDGNWKGNMYVSYQINGRGEYYDASYSEVCFLRNPSKYASGDGYWIDYYNDYRRYGWERNYIANHIKWEVINGNIRIHFIEENSYVTIYEYCLTDNHFSGYIEMHNGARQKFSLVHTSSPNWSSYHWGSDRFYFNANQNNFGIEEGASYANKSFMDLEDGVSSNNTNDSSAPVQLQRVFKLKYE